LTAPSKDAALLLVLLIVSICNSVVVDGLHIPQHGSLRQRQIAFSNGKALTHKQK